MYVEVLSGAMDRWDTELSGEALVDYVLSCRAALPAQDLGAGSGRKRPWLRRSSTTEPS